VNITQCESFSNTCGIYGGICREKCSTITASDATCNQLSDCFWLYSGNSGAANEGSCMDRIDTTLQCSSVENFFQCVSGLGGTALDNDCFWLLRDPSAMEGACMEKVWCNIL
jgi:hypothetical protein